MALLTQADLIDALTKLGQLAQAEGQFIELLIVGGGLMVLEFGSRSSTRDLDGVVTNSIDHSKVREYASKIAMQHNWPEDWLNDGAKGFLTGQITPTEVFSSAGITVCRPSYEQLLAMKLCAWRDDIDIADAQRLLLELSGDQQHVWHRIQTFLQPGKELKARYAFDDLWEQFR